MKKIKNIQTEVEDDLGNKEIISLKTFIALCVCNDFNILLVDNKSCFQLTCKTDSLYSVVHCYDNKKRFAIELDVENEKVEEYKKKLYLYETIDKPVMAIGNYKVDELKNICNKMEIVIDGKKTKKELYELIVMKM